MIHAESLAAPYQTRFSCGELSAIADTTAEKGGAGSGFRPHDLLEAALACCMTMTLRMYAEKHALPWAGSAVEVVLNRQNPEQPLFECKVLFADSVPEMARARMLQIVERCPVRRTLSGAMGFALLSSGA